MFAADAKLAAVEPESSDDSNPNGNNGGGRMAANNSSSDIALGAYSSSNDCVIKNFPQISYATYQKRARFANLSTMFTLFACPAAQPATYDGRGFRNP